MNKMRLTFSRGVQETMEPALCGRWPLSLPKCTKRIQLATDIDIQNLPVSLLAMSIVASTAYTPKNRQEEALVAYASALLTKGLHLNDYHSGRTALQWAAYDGYNEILLLLLRSNCSILGTPNRFIRLEKCHALYSAVKNCQHDSVRLLFAHRQDECRAELEKEARHYSSGTLVKAFVAKDVEMVRLLQPQKAKIPHWSALTTGSRIEDFTKHTEKILKELSRNSRCFDRTH